MKPALANFTSTIVEDILKTLTTTAAVAAARSTGCYPSSRFSRHYYQQQREERLVDRTAAAQPYTSNAADNNRKFTSLVSSSVPPPPTTSNYSHPPLSRVGDNDASITHHSLHTHMRSSPELNRPASPFKRKRKNPMKFILVN